MAIISYKVCDVCGSKIKENDDFTTFNLTIPVFRMNETQHICMGCYRKMKEWINAQKGAKEDE